MPGFRFLTLSRPSAAGRGGACLRIASRWLLSHALLATPLRGAEALDGFQLGWKKKSDPDAPATDNLAYNRPAAASSEEHKQDQKGNLCYVTIEMLDADGKLCPRAMDMLRFEIDGPAELKGVANGDPMGLDSFTDDRHPLFYGKAVAVLRSLPGQPGTATLKVTAGGMQATTRLTTKSP